MDKLIAIWYIHHLRLRWTHRLSQSRNIGHLIGWWTRRASIAWDTGVIWLLIDIKHSDRWVVHEPIILVAFECTVLLIKLSRRCTKVMVIYRFLRAWLLIWSVFDFWVRTILDALWMTFWLLWWSRWVHVVIYWSFGIRWLVVVHSNIIFIISSVSWTGMMDLIASWSIIVLLMLSVWFRSAPLSGILFSLAVSVFVFVLLFPWHRLLALLISISMRMVLVIILLLWRWWSHTFLALLTSWRMLMS